MDESSTDESLMDELGDLFETLVALIGDEADLIANAANTAALLFERMPRLNWAGFYFLRRDTLVLGPFQGRVACVRIPLGIGVCGAAAQRRTTIIVPDVHEFPGHIACDAASRSELVVPMLRSDTLVGVLDLDSPVPGRFSEADARLVEQVAMLLMRASPA